MSLESSLGLFLDVLIAVLLVAAIGFGFVLNRRLTALRKATEDANGMVGGFDAATKAARESVDALGAAGKDTGRQLQDQINAARQLRDELQFLTDAGENSFSAEQKPASKPQVDQADPGLAETRALELAAEVTREAENTATDLEPTEAERELREAKLRAVEATIQSLLITYDEQEEAQLQSVVAIYEAMKPKDAAKIFNELDLR